MDLYFVCFVPIMATTSILLSTTLCFSLFHCQGSGWIVAELLPMAHCPLYLPVYVTLFPVQHLPVIINRKEPLPKFHLVTSWPFGPVCKDCRHFTALSASLAEREQVCFLPHTVCFSVSSSWLQYYAFN